MANVIKLKNSGTANSAPTSLEAGELAINYADGKIYYKNASNTIVAFNTTVTLDSIFDVAITNPEEFQGLSYNGANWVNSHTPLVSYVRNAEANTITTGTCVYLFGSTGDHATVKRADNNSDTTSSKTIGVAGANIAASQNGPIITRGYVDGIDLSVGYTAGDVLWLGENGAFTKTKPTSPDHLVFIGVVVRATNNGIIYVATQNGYELDEIHNVQISNTLASGDFLKYDGTLWVNDPINLGTDTVGDYVQSLVAGTGITLSNNSGESATPTIAIGQDVATTANPTFAGITLDSVRVGITAANEIDTTSGNLILDSASGTTQIDDAVTISGITTVSNYINRVTSSGNSSWLQQDGTGRVHWYWNTLGGTSPVFTNAAEDASSITQHVTLNGNGGSVFFRSASGTAASAGSPISWTTTLYVDLNTLTFKGNNIVHAGSTGLVTSTMIADGTIVNADISTSAAIALSKLASGTSAQVVLANSTGVPTYTTISGDITISNTGVVTIAANSVALGTDTTGNYVQSLVAGTGITLTNATASEGGTPTIAVTADTYQPLDADLTAIGALSGTSGILKKTAANTWELDTATYLTSASTLLMDIQVMQAMEAW